MGKTSLALAVMYDDRIAQVYQECCHWIPCDQTPSIPLLLEFLARSFSVRNKTAERLSDILTHLRSDQNPPSRLLVIDNFETLALTPLSCQSARTGAIFATSPEVHYSMIPSTPRLIVPAQNQTTLSVVNIRGTIETQSEGSRGAGHDNSAFDTVKGGGIDRLKL